MPRPRRKRRQRCPFCRTLFPADPRVGPRQRAWGQPVGQRPRHAQNGRAWRRRNRAVTRRHSQAYIRLQRQAARTPPGPPPSAGHVQRILACLRPEWRDVLRPTSPAQFARCVP